MKKSGQEFDSSYNRKVPFDFVLGRGAVIPGWDEGVAGMKVGGRRLLTIPPHLGYGSAGTVGIPGGATLVFDVELVAVKPV
jgi:FKBP-type peptidyl-prolyl cis-trans isomerase